MTAPAVTPRIVLILPSTTYRAAAFLQAARALGARVLVATDHRQALERLPGAHQLHLDLDDAETAAAQIARAVATTGDVQAVVAVDDRGVLVAALAARKLGIPHNPPWAVAATIDKVHMREALAQRGVAQPVFAVPDATSPASVADACRHVGFPCVVKPTFLSGSRGVIRADDDDGARRATARVARIVVEAGGDPTSQILVERFVAGAEIAVEGMLRHGRLEVLAVFDKPDPLDGPFFEETIYVTPSRLPAAVQGPAISTIAAATTALGLTDGPVHGELRIEEGDGAPVVIEVACRTIGGMCSRALELEGGVTLEQLVVAHALGGGGPELRQSRANLDESGAGRRGTALPASGVMMLPIPASGVLEGVSGREAALATPGITGLEITIPAGRMVRRLPEGDRYLGFLFASGRSPGGVEHALRVARSRLEIRIALS